MKMALLEGGHNWKYVDRYPDLRTAGKLLPVGDRVEACLQETTPTPGTPPMVKKFRNSSRPEVGAVCIFHGKANDPDIASTMHHGKRTKQAITAGLLINPLPKTLIQQRLCQLQEAGYFTYKKAPLGRSRDQSPHLPNGLDTLTTTFGLKNLKGLTAGELVNPPKTASQVEKESKEGHGLYIQSHESDFADKNTRVLASKNSNDFREKFQPQTGKVPDPIADKLNVPPDHTFGISMPSQNFGVGDLMDSCYSEKFLKGSERHLSIVTAVQERLKKANFQNFNSLLQAFKYYDMKNQGWIDREDLQKVCTQLDLVLSPQILDSLMDYCDINKDGKIDFTEFANFLNWKERTPINAQEQQILTGVLKPSTAPALVRRLKIQELGERSLSAESEALVRPEDLELIRANSTLKTPKTLSRPRSVPCSFATSSSVIGATVGHPSTANYRSYGILTVRTDLPIPRIKRIGDRTNYGDESARDLLNPTLFSLRGVHQEHFLTPRPRQEIERIFRNVGGDIPQAVLEEAWKLASMRHPTGEVKGVDKSLTTLQSTKIPEQRPGLLAIVDGTMNSARDQNFLKEKLVLHNIDRRYKKNLPLNDLKERKLRLEQPCPDPKLNSTEMLQQNFKWTICNQIPPMWLD